MVWYTGVDQQIYQGGDQYVPMEQFRLGPYNQKNLSYESTTQPQSYGITNTNAFTNSGGSFSPTGNVFGYGTAIDPVAYGQYGAPGYEGGLPGNVQQYGVGRQFTGDELGMGPLEESYSYKKEVPGWMRVGAGFIPFGNTALNFLENKMNQNRGTLSGYRMGGLDEIEKGAYNQLAGQGLLFEGSSGLKTATGKNFGAKGYFEGQQSIWDENYAGKKEEDIEAELQAYAKAHGNVKNWQNTYKAKKYYEAKTMRDYDDKQKQKEIDDYNLLQAQKTNPEILSPHNPLIGKIDHTGSGGDVHSAVTRAPGSKGPKGTPTHSTRDDLMASGGRVGLNYGGLASMLGREDFKKGGRIGFFKGAQADTKEGKAMSPGTSATGGLRTGADGPDNKDKKKLTISPVIDTKYYSQLGGPLPTGVFGFNALTPFGKLKATANLKNYVKGDDVEPTLDYQGNIGPVDINAIYSDDVQNINASINKNNWNAGVNYDAITGEPTFGFNYSKTFKNGGLASIL